MDPIGLGSTMVGYIFIYIYIIIIICIIFVFFLNVFAPQQEGTVHFLNF